MTLPESSSPDALQIAFAPRRLEILRLIWSDERTVSDIAGQLPISVPAVSQHLAKLREAGLVSVRPDGRKRYYTADHASMGNVSSTLRPLLGTPSESASPPDPHVHSLDPGWDGSGDGAWTDSGETRVEPAGDDLGGPLDLVAADPHAPGELAFAPPHDDEMTSWYRQGLGARVVALRAAKQAVEQGQREAVDSLRRIARSLTRPSIAERFPDIARSALAMRHLPEGGLVAATDRLIGAVSQEVARDDSKVARVLVVEDSRMEAALIRSVVSGSNREVIWAQSAEDAQRIVDRQAVDIILLDLGLPGEDGRELLARLARRPRTRAIPVILLTGRADLQTRTEVLSLGADTFLNKPVEPPVLATTVSMLLERSADARQAGRPSPLTRLPNRTVFLSDIRQLAASAERVGTDLSFVILDIHRLDGINDAHGTEVGDAALRAVAEGIREAAHESDITARWGGGKFALLLSGADADETRARLEELTTATNRRRLPLADGSELVVTWHAGAAGVSGAGSVNEAIARATRRLQVASRQQSARIVTTDDEGAAGAHHVLVIEDDAILGDLMTHRLTREGFEVTRFDNGADALRAMGELTASAVVLDVMLPGADGFEILRRIRSQPSFAGVPVVVLTFGGDHDARRAVDLGASGSLARPF